MPFMTWDPALPVAASRGTMDNGEMTESKGPLGAGGTELTPCPPSHMSVARPRLSLSRLLSKRKALWLMHWGERATATSSRCPRQKPMASRWDCE